MMTTERAKQIISSYGGHFEQWPVDERLALQDLLFSNPELVQDQQQAIQIDEKIEQVFAGFKELKTKQLEQKILLNLPDRETVPHSQTDINKNGLKKFWENNKLFQSFFYPTKAIIAVALILLFTVSLLQFNKEHQVPILISNSMEDELLLMAEALDNSYELELLAMLEPELLEDDLDGTL